MKARERKYSRTERIVAKGKFSAWVFARTVLLAVILGGLIAVVWIFKDQIEGFFTKAEHAQYLTDTVMKYVLLGAGVIVLISLLIQTINLNARELLLTEDKVIYCEGALSVKTTVIPLGEIKLVETKQNFFQRLVGVCDMLIVSDAVQPYVIKNIKGADRLARRIMRQISEVRKDSSRRAQVRLVG